MTSSSLLSHLKHWQTHHKRLADYIAYIAMSLVIAAVLLIAIIERPNNNAVPESFFILFIATIPFKHLISNSRKLWKRAGYWCLIATLLLLHCIFWLFVLHKTGDSIVSLPFLVFWMFGLMFELALFRFITRFALEREKRHYLPE